MDAYSLGYIMQCVVMNTVKRDRVAQRYNCNKAIWSLYYTDQACEGLADLERRFDPEAVLEDLTRKILSAPENTASYVPQNHYPRPQWKAQCEHSRRQKRTIIQAIPANRTTRD